MEKKKSDDLYKLINIQSNAFEMTPFSECARRVS